VNPLLHNCWVENVYDGSVGCKMNIKEHAVTINVNPLLRNCWVENVYDGSVGCKMYITEHVGHEK
jgi:hypothetical protein